MSFSIWHINEAPLNESQDGMLSFSKCEKAKDGGLSYKSMDHEGQSGRRSPVPSRHQAPVIFTNSLFPSPEMGCQPM